MAENSSSKQPVTPIQNPPLITPPFSKIPKPKNQQQKQKQQKTFPSHLQNPNLSPQAKILCDILTKSPPQTLQSSLSSSGITPLPDLVEEVLSLSYGSPSAAVTFFRWAGIVHKHSPHSWNLMVDLLGKNKLFEPMWDAIRSMKQEGSLSPLTFVSIFESYCSADRIDEALMSFDVMERYGVELDIVAVNSLLSAICRESGQMGKALEFFDRIKTKIAPDADSFAILLEGWEKEGNAVKAKTTFGEMVIRVGWSPQYVSAYDSFLTTLLAKSQVEDAMTFLHVMQGKNCLPGLKFFSNALDILVKQNDSARAIALWGLMVNGGLVPNLIMYNAMIGLLCNNNDIENAFCFLDVMAFHGAFPDSLSYNMIFHCLTKNKKVREARRFFYEMMKNECPPTNSNYALGIEMFLDRDDPETAVELWESMINNRVFPLENSANVLLNGFTAMDRLTEVLKFLEDFLDRRIKIHDATMEKMKTAFSRKSRSASLQDTFQLLTKKWKPS